jgi:FtsP/CotA-like multicopper oxidase with cupredoxin domain
VVRIPYPLIPTGEVLFKLILNKDGKQVGLSSVRIRLVKAGAAPVDGLTEFDGTVSFEHLPIGTYRLELDPDQAARLHMRLKAPVNFTVPADGGFVPDQKGEVEFEAAPAPAASPAAAKPGPNQ